MRNVRWVGALWIGLCGCGQDLSSGPSSQFELEGQVLDDLTGAGVQHAQVDFSSDTLDRAETSTDPDGRFTLEVSVREGVAFGIVSAAHERYEPGTARSVYFDGTTHVITLRLRAKSKTK
jgi:hypothetical protein